MLPAVVYLLRFNQDIHVFLIENTETSLRYKGKEVVVWKLKSSAGVYDPESRSKVVKIIITLMIIISSY